MQTLTKTMSAENITHFMNTELQLIKSRQLVVIILQIPHGGVVEINTFFYKVDG